MTKTYTKLYSRDENGNTRMWYIVQEDNSYTVYSGTIDNCIPNSTTVVEEGKNKNKRNETTPVEQACKEIEAIYKKKLKLSYFENIEDIDKSNFIEPMLAEKYKDYADDVDFTSKEWGVQTKYNGVCMVASKRGLFSRKGEQFKSVPHIEESLAPFFKKYPNAVLHGELFNESLKQDLNDIISLCRKTKKITAQDLVDSEKIIRYYIYDGYNADVKLAEDASYTDRKEWIDQNVIDKYDYCERVSTIIATSKAQVDKLFENVIANGDEGLILRYMPMPYRHARSKNLLKYKPLDTDEMEILDINEGTGNWKGKANIITVKMKDGRVFNATFKGKMPDAVTCLKNKDKWIGKIVTIEYVGLTGLGCPNYAKFNYRNCLRLD